MKLNNAMLYYAISPTPKMFETATSADADDTLKGLWKIAANRSANMRSSEALYKHTLRKLNKKMNAKETTATYIKLLVMFCATGDEALATRLLKIEATTRNSNIKAALKHAAEKVFAFSKTLNEDEIAKKELKVWQTIFDHLKLGEEPLTPKEAELKKIEDLYDSVERELFKQIA